GATAALLLTCLWGGSRYPWGSAPIVVLVSTMLVLSGLLVARERRTADPIVPLWLLGTPVVAIASAALFLATASLFAVTVFVPVFGLVTQVLIVAVQNAVERQRLGIATATTSFFRALGGAISAAVLGVVFTSGAGASAQSATLHALDAAARIHITGAVQTV